MALSRLSSEPPLFPCSTLCQLRRPEAHIRGSRPGRPGGTAHPRAGAAPHTPQTCAPFLRQGQEPRAGTEPDAGLTSEAKGDSADKSRSPGWADEGGRPSVYMCVTVQSWLFALFLPGKAGPRRSHPRRVPGCFYLCGKEAEQARALLRLLGQGQGGQKGRPMLVPEETPVFRAPTPRWLVAPLDTGQEGSESLRGTSTRGLPLPAVLQKCHAVSSHCPTLLCCLEGTVASEPR